MTKISKKQRKGKEIKKNLPLDYEVGFIRSYKSEARTLPAINGLVENTGWTIDAEIHEDYYKWINEFDAYHPEYGRVAGNFESIVRASSKEAYEQFIKDHPYQEWDYYDI